MTASDHSDATWAAGLLALCGPALGGALIAEEQEASFLSSFRLATGTSWEVVAIPASVTLETLTGSLDLAATLASGKPVHAVGLLQAHGPAAFLLRRAERVEPACAAAIADGIDSKSFMLLAVTTARDSDEAVSPRLTERLPFLIASAAEGAWTAGQIDTARVHLHSVAMDDAWLKEIVGAAMALGVQSPRTVVQAVLAARAVAALKGHPVVQAEDMVIAARLVFAHRVSEQHGEPEEQSHPEQAVHDDRPPEEPSETPETPEKTDIIVEAVKAILPPDILAMLVARGGRKAAGRNVRTSAIRKANGERGRRIGHKRASSLARQKLDVLATLRSAAPWQPLRRKLSGLDRMVVSRDDFRVVRIKRRNEATAIFVVDASGSTAFQRLAEAKGAVETVLAECYVRRDKAALISFRSKSAEVLLPPTRSLERAKRTLSGMPGGGGTPLAAALDKAFSLAIQVKRGGGTPTIILMTDGRANVTRDGEGNKARAMEETLSAGRALAAEGIDSMVIDVSPEPQKHARNLANAMGARYLPMPRAGAHEIARPVGHALRSSKG